MRTLLVCLSICLISAGSSAQSTTETCVDVQVGTARSYACLNQKLQDAAHRAASASTGGAPPYSATSPGNVTGQFNESATRNRLGSNFGKSVTPERPSTSFSSPR